MNSNSKKLDKINHVINSLLKEGIVKSVKLLDDGEFYSVVAEVNNNYSYSIHPELIKVQVENFLQMVNKQWIKIDKDIDDIDLIFVDETNKLNESVGTRMKDLSQDDIDRLENALNKFMPKYFDWWVDSKVTFCDYSKAKDSQLIIIETELKVLDDWFHKSFREYYHSQNFPDISEEGLDLGFIIGPKLSKEINEKVKFIAQSVFGEIFKLLFQASIVELVDRDDIPDKILDEQLTKPNDVSILKDYKKIIFTGNTHQELGLSRIETPQTLLDKVNKNFSIPVFRLSSSGYDFPVYRLEGKLKLNNKEYIIDLRPETGTKFALIGTIKIPIN